MAGVKLQVTGKTPISVLQELYTKKIIPCPNYKLVCSRTGTHQPQHDYTVTLADIEASGSGQTKQIGRQRAAYHVLTILKNRGICNFEDDFIDDYKISMDSTESTSYISTLQTKCANEGIHMPELIQVMDEGPPHAKRYAYECRLGSVVKRSKVYTTTKIAKQMACFEMLQDFEEALKNGDFNMDTVDTDADVETEQLEKILDTVRNLELINKQIQPGDIITSLRQLIKKKNLHYADFKCYLDNACEDSLNGLLEKLGIKHKLQELQRDPSIVEIALIYEATFTILGMGYNFETAKQSAIKQFFERFNVFLQEF